MVQTVARNFTIRNVLLAGILLMLAGDFMFALNDAMGKWLVASFSVGQVVLIRSIGAFIVLGPMIANQGAGRLFHMERPLLQVLRVVATTTDTALFYAAVVYLPLADVMSFYMAGPIYVAALSHLLLGEKVGWRRWLAILIGFCGVLIILKPSSAAFSMSSGFALVGSIAFAFAIILSRLLRGTSDTTLVTWQTIGTLLVGGVLAVGAWRTPSALDFGAMLLLGVVSCAAHLMITRALKLAPASTLAPLHYSLLLWAIVFGLAFFGDVPSLRILIGAAIVVLAGLFIFHRQKVVETEVPPENVPKGVN
ncbi:DMT family transporter [Mesorhizobium sp. M2D.F.Ca.ET.185.01.1.1]|uniref:DMT family transporter n=1 Tax=unclassified Mesorhizobium TaxID=325217 RepID=UPI000FCBEDDB|nr:MULTISPECIES: DMT family transporter [unclassified Mesorhizobium]TGP51099.1 DMT family transporter [bacterium M00.F.Ca.ET.230.01.1.1]TGP78175.1 DMT family transporter [bacterium M00.F.Ca.ET.227.01.1.1]TGP88297.1 DMT family transporter [bacterium M00.F.Ca.ET.221.01.1.1]TGP93509.1 DMT family transporter [bacterium M00.F.Ca.ET.222.01.1.1]TGT72467.1 DMT family transporter [bacterium M00.F.Ca.ET.159.01.1.1]TGT85636.1 DMT family transporter [bacterium M00.F.Ca.ET.157.01.1.1]TGU12918.1 DMT famil